MYYILNQTNQIIAADAELLSLCGVTHIDELHLNVAREETSLLLTTDKSVTIDSKNHHETYETTSTSLSSMLGSLTLVELLTSPTATLEIQEETPPLNIDLDSEPFILDAKPVETITSPETSDDDMLFTLNLDEEETEETEETEVPEAEEPMSIDEEPISFDFSIKDEDSPLNNEPAIEITSSADEDEIYIDIEKLSKQIGISEEDYSAFLDEYIDTALALEKELKNTQSDISANAISTLFHLSNSLQLDKMSAFVSKIENASDNEKDEAITSFYTGLSSITTSAKENTPLVEEKVELFDIFEEKVAPAQAPTNPNSFGHIDLSNVKPIHFDFRLEEAATDLSLPIDLIEEFVHDFIEQAHTETDKMLKAYEAGDLDAIQKIGHLLKGASSNLRINALSDTLYNIQFCEESSQLEQFIKSYWGHFLSFELQINALAK